MSKQSNLFRSSLLAKSIRASQFQTSTHISTGVLALALSAGMINAAFAQEKLEEIQITGSRVTRSTMDCPTWHQAA